MSLSRDLDLLATMMRAGDVSPACQRATSAKLASLAGQARRMETLLDDVVADAMAEARQPPVVVQFPAERRVVPVQAVGRGWE